MSLSRSRGFTLSWDRFSPESGRKWLRLICRRMIVSFHRRSKSDLDLKDGLRRDGPSGAPARSGRGRRVEQHAEIALPIDDRRTEQRRSEPEIFHPLLPSKASEVDISAMLSEAVPGDVASAQPASIGLLHDRGDTSIVGAAWMAQVAVEDGPTADRRNAIAAPPVSGLRERAGMLAAVAGDAGKPARAEFSAPSRRSAQSDDIQIHIGRIEVTAVAQPTPRPAAAPARKAMSLDEYLIFINGKNRRRGVRKKSEKGVRAKVEMGEKGGQMRSGGPDGVD